MSGQPTPEPPEKTDAAQWPRGVFFPYRRWWVSVDRWGVTLLPKPGSDPAQLLDRMVDRGARASWHGPPSWDDLPPPVREGRIQMVREIILAMDPPCRDEETARHEEEG